MADVGVVERGDRAGFAGEALGELRVGNFDRDIAIQPGIMRAIHLAHAALADGRKDFVGAEFVADRKRHTRDFSLVYSIWVNIAALLLWFGTAPVRLPRPFPDS